MSKDKFEPMLAERKLPDLDKLEYPVYGSPKLDGIRNVVIGGQALSRSLKQIQNNYIYNLMSRPEFSGLDGELIVGSPVDPNVYDITNSAVMSRAGEPDFKFYAFDDFTNPHHDYCDRLLALRMRCAELLSEDFAQHIVLHEAVLLHSKEEVLAYENEQLELGYEGIILRHPKRRYKYGRSTMKEMGMLKLKRFLDEEFEIVGYEELMHNSNKAEVNELGRTKRSKAQEGMVPMNTLGALVCKVYNGQSFTEDRGLTFKAAPGKGINAERNKELWEIRDTLLGQLAKVRFFPIGVKDKPRMGKFVGTRSKDDMS